jgi:phosphomannomutase
MDERKTATDCQTAEYRCPGESYTIDRAVHLGRLAAFYPACRQCEHRTDTHALSPLQARQWDEVERRLRRGPGFTTEGLEGASPHDVDSAVARRAGEALGILLTRERIKLPPPTVLVGALGDAATAELVAAACAALQWAGCHTLEVGAATSASLVAATRHLHGDAALLIGNASGEPHAISLKFWGSESRPWSSPGGLDRLREQHAAPSDRPTRRAGALARAVAAEIYLAPLVSLFHGLRPLRFVLDTRCEVVHDYLRCLNAQAACEILRPRTSRGAGTARADIPFTERRAQLLHREVQVETAHFGLWIDGDGERCRLFDEHGRAVDGESLLLLLGGYVCRQQPGATLVLERDASERLVGELARRGANTVRCDASRQETCEAMRRAGAVFGGGPSGRFWYGEDAGAPDALMTLSLLLTILSQSDRPLSEVLDAA